MSMYRGSLSICTIEGDIEAVSFVVGVCYFHRHRHSLPFECYWCQMFCRDWLTMHMNLEGMCFICKQNG